MDNGFTKKQILMTELADYHMNGMDGPMAFGVFAICIWVPVFPCQVIKATGALHSG